MSTLSTIAPHRARFSWYALLPPLITAIALGAVGYFSGLGTSSAVHTQRLQTLEQRVEKIDQDKVSKDQFGEFKNSIDGLREDVRELRKDLATDRARGGAR